MLVQLEKNRALVLPQLTRTSAAAVCEAEATAACGHFCSKLSITEDVRISMFEFTKNG